MTDARPEPAPDPAGAAPTAGQSPPSGAWWSRPDGQWGAPRPDGRDEAGRPEPGWTDQTQPFARSGPPQPAYGTTYGSGPYGAAGPGASHPSDPWSSPATRATFPSDAWSTGPSGAPPTGPPVDSIGRPVGAPGRSGSRRGLGTAAAVLATALVAGSVGGLLGARSQDDGNLLDPTASLGGAGSSSASVDRAPESVAGIAAKVMQSTVSISVSGRGGQGTGSGVVIRSDGYILTNNHVVESAEAGGEITVALDGAEGDLPAKIVGLDPVTDLAVLQVQGGGQMPAAALGQSRDLVVGDPVIAIGSPLGLSGTVTTGIVSALNRTVNTPAKDGTSFPLFNAIQTDAAINPGNSGGALVNARGEVIGINSAIATLGGGLFGGEQTGGSIGVGFAIPIDEARSVAEEIIRTGRATHPSIGISATTVVGDEREGALVRALTPGGAAGAAGLRPNDLIIRLDDTEVTSVDELILATREHKVGDTVTVTYLRGSEERTVEIQLQDLQAN